MDIEPFQDLVDWHCYGCGRSNDHGLQIKSRWESDEVVCRWQPQPYHVGLPGWLQGGVLATVIVCHALWTATATACRDEGIAIEEPMPFAYSTTSLQLDFLEPIPVDGLVTLRGACHGDRRRACDGVVRRLRERATDVPRGERAPTDRVAAVTSAAPRPVDLTYLDQGSGPVVMLVHGSNTDQRIWAPHAAIVGQRHRVIAPTQRYFGSAPWPDDGRDFSISTHAADLADFIRRHRLEPVALVGWSYGAAVCLQMAVDQPELATRLILYEPAIASFVQAPEEADAAAADRLEMTAQARDRTSQGDASTAVRLFMDGVNGRRGSFDGLPVTVQDVMLENSGTLRLLFGAPPPSLSCEDLARLEGTTVVVARGSATRTFYRIAAEWTAACVPASTLVVVPNARHLFPVEDHAGFTALILDLLASPAH